VPFIHGWSPCERSRSSSVVKRNCRHAARIARRCGATSSSRSSSCPSSFVRFRRMSSIESTQCSGTSTFHGAKRTRRSSRYASTRRALTTFASPGFQLIPNMGHERPVSRRPTSANLTVADQRSRGPSPDATTEYFRSGWIDYSRNWLSVEGDHSCGKAGERADSEGSESRRRERAATWSATRARAWRIGSFRAAPASEVRRPDVRAAEAARDRLI
jgi:hypothetical protein